MTIRTHVLAATAAIGSLTAPAAAQYYPEQPSYPQYEQTYPQYQQYQQVPQPYPGQPGYGYSQPAYGYGYAQQGSNQGYAAQDPINQILNSLLGNRYNVSDRQAVSQCASAAVVQATAQYGVNGYAGSNGYAGYAGAYRPGATGVPGYPGIATSMRVSAITDVQRRSSGMRVKGLIDSGVDYRGGYGGQAYEGAGTGGQAYATRYPSHNDLSFRCNLDNRGIVTSMRVERNTTTYRRF
jgi:hypothetical protein